MRLKTPSVGAAAPTCALLIAFFISITAAAATEGSALFRDITEESGLRFEYVASDDGQMLLPAITGGGVALFDFDNDGDLDLYFVQGGSLPAATFVGDSNSSTEKNRVDSGGQPAGRLFRNEWRPGAALLFTDISTPAIPMLSATSFSVGMGVTTGDFDNDGWTDLYLLNLGKNTLLHNDHGKKFVDVTEQAAVGDPGWSSAAAALDFDRDGWLDLFVVNYLLWSPDRVVRCFATNTRRDYCGPAAYPPTIDRLYRNRGDGTFSPLALEALAAAPGPGLGVMVLDANDDGWPDIYVANDGSANRLWLNGAGRSLTDGAAFAGVAVNRRGLPEAGMGIAAGDADNDGDEDLVISHLTAETNTLYRNDGGGLFSDRTITTGLGPASLPWTGFGIAWLDVDSDSWLDLLVVNGAVKIAEGGAAQPITQTATQSTTQSITPQHEALVSPPNPLGQPNLFFRNQGNLRFVDHSAQMPESFQTAEASRGLGVGDLDNDGDLDFVTVQSSGWSRVYRNEVTALRMPLGLRLLSHQRDALGATVALVAANSEAAAVSAVSAAAVRAARSNGSYASANDPRVLLPLPAALDAARQKSSTLGLVVHWPSGRTEQRSVQLPPTTGFSGYLVLEEEQPPPNDRHQVGN